MNYLLTSAEKYILAIIKSSVSDTECEDLIAKQDDYDEIIRIIQINSSNHNNLSAFDYVVYFHKGKQGKYTNQT